MSVDYLICAACRETYPDCSSNAKRCTDDYGGCGKGYCSESCAELQNLDGQPFPDYRARRQLTVEQDEALHCSCVDCRGELANDQNLFVYVLEKLKLSREDLKKEYLARKRKVSKESL